MLLPITLLAACTLIWWWPEVRLALRLPGHTPKLAMDTGAGLAQIALPSSWRQTSALNAHAALQAADRFHNRYVMVISESLADFDTTVNLRDFSQRAVQRMMKKLDVANVDGPFERAVAALDAVQYEFTARVRGQRITYLHTTVLGRRAFHQVICWSASSSFNRQAFERVLEGFAEQPGPVPLRPHPGATLTPPEPGSQYTIH